MLRAFLVFQKLSDFSAFSGFKKRVFSLPGTTRKTHLLTNMEMTRLDIPVPSLFSTCYSGRVAESGIGLPSRSNATQTGFIECIR